MSTLSQNPNRLNVEYGELVSGVVDGKPFVGPVRSTDDAGLIVSINGQQRRIPWTTAELRTVEDGQPLTMDEKSRLFQLEQVVARGLQTAFDVWAALGEIRDRRLYRTTHTTFQAYCDDKWGFSKTQANRLIASAEVAQDLTPFGVKPQSEAQLRPLTKLDDPEQRREAWSIAVEQSGTEQPPGRAVAAAVQQVLAPAAPVLPPEPPQLTREPGAEIWWTDRATGNLRAGKILNPFVDGYVVKPTDGGMEPSIFVPADAIGEGEIPREPAPFGLCAGCHTILRQPFHITATGRKCGACHRAEPERPLATTVTPAPLSAPQISDEERLDEHARARRWMELETVFEHASELLFDAVTTAHEIGEPQRELAGLILRLAPAADPEWQELREWAQGELAEPGGAA